MVYCSWPTSLQRPGWGRLLPLYRYGIVHISCHHLSMSCVGYMYASNEGTSLVCLHRRHHLNSKCRACPGEWTQYCRLLGLLLKIWLIVIKNMSHINICCMANWAKDPWLGITRQFYGNSCGICLIWITFCLFLPPKCLSLKNKCKYACFYL